MDSIPLVLETHPSTDGPGGSCRILPRTCELNRNSLFGGGIQTRDQAQKCALPTSARANQYEELGFRDLEAYLAQYSNFCQVSAAAEITLGNPPYLERGDGTDARVPRGRILNCQGPSLLPHRGCGIRDPGRLLNSRTRRWRAGSAPTLSDHLRGVQAGSRTRLYVMAFAELQR